MEIKRLKDNQIRCALTEEEIEEMGFRIDDIIGNGEISQKFMRVVLEKVEEQEQIDINLLSPMVRAELLPDHSMTITFGGITQEEKKDMFHKILEMMEMLSGSSESSPKPKAAPEFEQKLSEPDEEEVFKESTPLGLAFADIDGAVRVSRLFAGKEKIPQSSLYKMNEKYYLFMEFKGFSKQEIKPLAFLAVEYDNRRVAEPAGIAYIKEHGKCILAKDAVSSLLQL